MMKKFMAVTLCALMVFSLSACGGSGGAQDGVLDICLASEPKTIDPNLCSSFDGGTYIWHAFEGLVKWADDGAGGAELAPGMAESWEHSDDNLEWTFHLREDAKWSDGEPVTAHDFIFSWNRLASEETAADFYYFVEMVEGFDEGELAMEAVDDYTLKVKLSYYVPYFLEACAFTATVPLREDIIAEYGDQWALNPESYVSNGPFKLTEWQHDGYMIFEPNENYYDTEGLTSKIKFHLSADANAVYAGYQSGQLDYIQNFPKDEVPSLLADGTINVAPLVSTYYVSFQTEVAPFDDERVRKAFSMVIDRDYMAEQIVATGDKAAGGFVPYGLNDAEGSTGDDFRTVGGDLCGVELTDEEYEARCEEARQLLADAGYPGGEGFPVVSYLYDTSAGNTAVAEGLQNMWKTQLGVTVSLENVDWAVHQDRLIGGDFQLSKATWMADYNDPMTFMEMFITGGGNNDPRYANPEYDKLIANAKATLDPAERMQYMHEAEELAIEEDAILAPVYFMTQPNILREDIQGVYYSPLGSFFFTHATGQ